jgi:ComF family protein
MFRRLFTAPFPQECLLCSAAGALLCDSCAEEASAALRCACRQCAIPLQANGLCGACLQRPPAFDATVAAALYAPPFDQLILGLKFHAQLAHATLFADLLGERMRQLRLATTSAARFPALDLLIPVPLNSARLAQRGFNQAMEIARPLGQRLGVRVAADAVVRVTDTPHQAALPLDARHKNVRGAFAIHANVSARLQASQNLQGLRIGVIDDVMTTGATLNELAKTLKKAGASSVINLVVARTP